MDSVLGFIAGLAMMMCIFGLKVHPAIDESWRKQIVDHGDAEFYLDANNQRQWRWTPCK